jgi:hypothetical protein
MSRVVWLRLVVLILVGAAIVIAAVPLLVLLSLVQGGTGFGLCPGGIGTCRNPYTAAPELTVALTAALLALVAAIRVAMRTARRIKQESYQVADRPQAHRSR